MARTTGAKDKVDRAAVALFAARGFDGVSIADIALAAGVSQGALYRHYPSKDELAWALFSTAYLAMTAELDQIRAERDGFESRLAAMIGRFCALYDDDPAQFRFMLLAQHNLLARLAEGTRTPVEAVLDCLKDGIKSGQLAAIDPALGTAAIMGVVLQTATFHLYGRITGPLSPMAADLARAAIAAVRALPEGLSC